MSVCEHIHTCLVFLESVLPTPAGWASGQVYLPLTRFAWAFLEEEQLRFVISRDPCVGGGQAQAALSPCR